MHFSLLSLTFLAHISLISAKATPNFSNSTSLPESCATIKKEQANWISRGKELPSFHTPSVLWACLGSIPLNVDDVNLVLDYALDYYPFITTLGWLKDPPPAWERGAFDFIGALEEIAASVNSNSSDAIKSQLEFDLAVSAAALNTRDFHNNFATGIMDNAMYTFLIDFSVVALSLDGGQVPQIYVYEDILKSGDGIFGQNQSFTPSAITTMQGQDPVEFLRNFTQSNIQNSFIEEHTEWNTVMSSYWNYVFDGTVNFNTSSIYNGDSLTLTFENGTETTRDYRAVLSYDFSTAKNLEDLYEGLALAPTSSSSGGSAGEKETGADEHPENTFSLRHPRHRKTESAASKSAAKGKSTGAKQLGGPYPKPDVVQADLGAGGWITGYILEEQKLAIFSLPDFDNSDRSEKVFAPNPTFSNATQQFIQMSKAKGVKNVILDMQGNGGGEIALAYELFKNFFPEINPFGGKSMRETASWDALSNITSIAVANGTQDEKLIVDVDVAIPFNLFGYLDENGNNYTSFDQAAGPVMERGDDFTNTVRYDLSNSQFAMSLTGGGKSGLNDIFGYGTRKTDAINPWKPENIVLLTDGVCGSTCAIFAELTKTDAGVRRIAMGGVPSVPGAMQAVSGSRGSEVYAISDIITVVNEVRKSAARVAPGLDVSALPRARPTPRLANFGRVNIRNQVRFQSDVPLQFIYEAADCRLWYTPAMVTDMRVLWGTVADAVWGTGEGLCVPGSTGQVTALPNVTSTDAPGQESVGTDAQAAVSVGAMIMKGLGG